MLEGSRLQPGDALDASQPTRVRHQPFAGDKGEPDRQTKGLEPRATQAKRASNKASADLL